jgi:hypothetical protein
MTHEGKLQRLLICVLVNPRRIRCFVAHFTVDSRSTSSRRRRTIMLFVTHIIIAYIESKVITSLPTSPSPTQLSLHPSQTQPQSSINQPIEHPPLSTNPHHHALDNNHINHINHINHSHPNANPDPAPLPDPRPHPPNPLPTHTTSPHHSLDHPLNNDHNRPRQNQRRTLGLLALHRRSLSLRYNYRVSAQVLQSVA